MPAVPPLLGRENRGKFVEYSRIFRHVQTQQG